MGLLDDVVGSITGQGNSSSSSASSGSGMASTLLPILMAIMASKAGAGSAGGLGGMLGGQGGFGGMPGNAGGSSQSGSLGGLLGNLFGGGGASPSASASVPGGSIGGMLSGGGLAGALGQLVSSFQQNGHGSAVDSWVGNGTNASIAPEQVNEALGSNTLDQLSQHTGLPQSDIAAQLSKWLPQVVNRLTPNGRLPTPDEASEWT